jgi:hypothetical protein
MLITRVARGAAWRLRDPHGQALIEFALVVPVLMLLVLGIFDFGRALNYQNDETHLANEAVRYAAVGSCGGSGCSGGSIATQVANDADTPELRAGVSVTLCLPTGSSNAGAPVRANVSYVYRWLPSVVGMLGIPTTVTITASATQRLEKQATSGTPYGSIASSC